MSRMRLVSAFSTVGVWTLLSRILGFIRDILIAAFLGTGPVAEAFILAFSLPNLFRRFLAEGAFNMAFVPLFAKKLEGQGGALAFAQNTFTMLILVLLALCALANIFMPWLVWAMASGFSGDARFDLTVLFGRIAFPYILFISLAALLSGVLNALGRFHAAAATHALLNVVFIGAIYLGSILGWDAGLTLAWSVPIAGIAQFALVWEAARRAGYCLYPLMPRWTADVKRLLVIAAPAALAGGVVQVNLLVGRQIASYFEGANAWLYYADRLYQLPLGVVGIAIGIVLLPELSRRLWAKDDKGGQEAFNRASELSLALTLPCAVALVVISEPLMSVLFVRGAFTAQDAQFAALACAIYGLGLPAFVLHKVFQPLFFAREDTKTPFYYALISLFVNAGVAIVLQYWIGFSAAAVGTTLSAWVMLACLWAGSRQFGHSARLDTRLKARLWRIILASMLMGVIVYGAATLFEPWFNMAGVRYGALAGLVLLGAVSYAVFCQISGAYTLHDLRVQLRR